MNQFEVKIPKGELNPDGIPENEILSAIYNFLGRFVSYPNVHSHIAHTLWIAHTHLMDAWESTPRIAFLSPEPNCGKTRALEATAPLVPRPVEAVNVTPAYIFRKVGDEGDTPTILYDEIDTVFGPKAKENEELKGLLNAGHRRGAVAGRCVIKGKKIETEEIPAYSAVALAGIGGLPDTILSRCVVIRMKRRAPHEKVEPWRHRIHAPEGEKLRDRLAEWATSIEEQVTNVWPQMPKGIEDRDADLWEPLLSIADAADGDWPNKARVAAVALVSHSKESTPSLGIRLLKDIKKVFGDRDVMSTKNLLKALNEMEEAPWGDLRGNPLNSRALAQRLKPYDVKSKTVRIGEATPRGYTREDFWDAWQRYLSISSDRSTTSKTSATNHSGQGNRFVDVANLSEVNLQNSPF